MEEINQNSEGNSLLRNATRPRKRHSKHIFFNNNNKQFRLSHRERRPQVQSELVVLSVLSEVRPQRRQDDGEGHVAEEGQVIHTTHRIRRQRGPHPAAGTVRRKIPTMDPP